MASKEQDLLFVSTKAYVFQEWLVENQVIFGLALACRCVPHELNEPSELRREIWQRVISDIVIRLAKAESQLNEVTTTDWSAYEVDQKEKLVKLTENILEEATKNWREE